MTPDNVPSCLPFPSLSQCYHPYQHYHKQQQHYTDRATTPARRVASSDPSLCFLKMERATAPSPVNSGHPHGNGDRHGYYQRHDYHHDHRHQTVHRYEEEATGRKRNRNDDGYDYDNEGGHAHPHYVVPSPSRVHRPRHDPFEQRRSGGFGEEQHSYDRHDQGYHHQHHYGPRVSYSAEEEEEDVDERIDDDYAYNGFQRGEDHNDDPSIEPIQYEPHHKTHPHEHRSSHTHTQHSQSIFRSRDGRGSETAAVESYEHHHEHHHHHEVLRSVDSGLDSTVGGILNAISTADESHSNDRRQGGHRNYGRNDNNDIVHRQESSPHRHHGPYPTSSSLSSSSSWCSSSPAKRQHPSQHQRQQQRIHHRSVPEDNVVPARRSSSELNEHDVLCGRGGGTNSQEGNVRFRNLVKDQRPRYLEARRKDKPLIARDVVAVIRARGGRFLRRNENDGCYYEVGDVRAEAKTGQALREGLDVRAVMKERKRAASDNDTANNDNAKGKEKVGSKVVDANGRHARSWERPSSVQMPAPEITEDERRTWNNDFAPPKTARALNDDDGNRSNNSSNNSRRVEVIVTERTETSIEVVDLSDDNDNDELQSRKKSTAAV